MKSLLLHLLQDNKQSAEYFADRSGQLKFPLVDPATVISILDQVKDIFQNECIVLDIVSPVVVVGDIHGHYLDLLRIINNYGMPEDNGRKYLFLGDLVDRGEFSLECVLIIFLLKILWPKHVFIIRGNHEFEFLCTQCGFSSQLHDVYDDNSILEHFITVFSYIPLVALIDKLVLCVHGGIGPSWYTINQILRLERPINDFGSDLVDSMLWSDPSLTLDAYAPSNRGTGYFFGERAVKGFINDLNISMIVRAHECIESGCQVLFDGQLATVFSASNYCGLVGNNAAVMIFYGPKQYEIASFPPLTYIKRSEAIITQKVTMRAQMSKRTNFMQMPSSASVRTLPNPSFAKGRKTSPYVNINCPMTCSASHLQILKPTAESRNKQKLRNSGSFINKSFTKDLPKEVEE